MYDLGFRIKEIRTRRGLNQKELAQRINKSKSAVCGYETNAQIPPLEVLVSIASVLNVSLDYLVGFEETESFSTRSLSDQQKKIAGLLFDEFSNPTNASPRLSQRQVIIIIGNGGTCWRSVGRSLVQPVIHTGRKPCRDCC